MRYKANHYMVLPDGKTEINAGEEFDYDGDVSPFEELVEVVMFEATHDTPLNDEQQPDEEELIRKRGKELKINNYHNMGIENLKKRIELEEARLAANQAKNAETEAQNADEGENGND